MESIKCSSTDQNALNDPPEPVALAKVIDVSPAAAPFRKKAITSIERTRKLSILLKHQHYLVSYKAFSLLFFPFIRSILSFYDFKREMQNKQKKT